MVLKPRRKFEERNWLTVLWRKRARCRRAGDEIATRDRVRQILSPVCAALRTARRAKAEGVYKGRRASIDAAKVRAMKAKGVGATEMAKALKIGRASVYRALEGE
jgi:helix-turn-helix resolvase-like protein